MLPPLLPHSGRVSLAAAALALLLGAGCAPTEPDPVPSPDAGSKPADTPPRCEVDPALLAEARACRLDEDCACGSHCSLGTCVSECTSDADCEGATCDEYGRCAGEELLRVPSKLRVERTVVLTPTSTQGTFVVVPAVEGGGALRVAAEAPMEVRCDDTSAFASECWIDEPIAGRPVAVRVRLTAPPEEPTAGRVRVYQGGESVPADVRLDLGPGASRPLEGAWEGTATVLGYGLSSRSRVFLPEAPSTVALPVSLQVFPAAGEEGAARQVVARDAQGLVFPDAETLLELGEVEGALSLRQAVDRPYLAADAVALPGIEVGVRGESLEVLRGETVLTIEYRTRFLGVLDEASAPYVDWRLRLRRVGDLPADALPPEAPEAYVPAPVAGRAEAALAFEENAGGLAAALAALGDAAPDVRASLVACAAPDGTPRTLSGELDPASWSGDLGCVATLGGSGDGDGGVPDDTGDGASDGGPIGVAEIFPQQGFGLLHQQSWQLARTLGECVAELRALRDEGAPLATTPACVDGARVGLAIIEAQARDRARAFGSSEPANLAASALAHRWLTQWLGVHAFIAKQTHQVDVLNDIVPPAGRLEMQFTPEEMLELTRIGTDLLLHPRVAIPLSRMPTEVLRNPDYRGYWAPEAGLESDPLHEHDVGLPAVLLESLGERLAVHGFLVERARYQGTGAAALEQKTRGAMQKSLLLAALAAGLYQNTRASDETPPPWELRFVTATRDLDTAIAGLIRASESFRAGGNPLGIDDELDLPLYRIGDQVGSLARFSALTDYLLGTGTSLDDSAVVPRRVLAAETALEEARQAWSASEERAFTEAFVEAYQGRRVEAIRINAGNPVASLCGDYSPYDVLELVEEIDPRQCYLRPECLPDLKDRLASLEPDIAAYEICRLNEIAKHLGGAAIEAGLALPAAAGDYQPIHELVVEEERLLVRPVVGEAYYIPLSTFEADISVFSLPGEVQGEIHNTCFAVQGRTNLERPTELPGQCEAAGDCPPGYLCDGGACVPATRDELEPSCYRGAMGDLVLAIGSSVIEVDIARAEYDEHDEAYRIAMEACLRAQEGHERIVEATESFHETTRDLAEKKLSLDIAAALASAAKDCADAGSLGFQCGAAVAQAGLTTGSLAIQFNMDEVARAHDRAVLTIEGETAWEVCTTEAKLNLVGMQAAALRIEQAQAELTRQLVELDEMQLAVGYAISDGLGALRREQARAISPLQLDYWLDARIERYEDAFRAARRALYLGVLALEYEFQLSSVERGQVLAATRVSDLRGVLERLRNHAATGSVGGALPSELSAVVSLRDQLLRLTDRSQESDRHALTEEQRFRQILAAPHFARYADDGSYLGQAIPFRVEAYGRLGIGDDSIALLTGSDCAERLWSVNAVVLGEDAMEGNATRTRFTLRQRNTFSSQWCQPREDRGDVQLASTRPSRNLFLDPFSDYVPGGEGSQRDPVTSFEAHAEANAYTAARLSPLLNIPRAELERDGYSDGASRELAGRGLYGDYELFIPAEQLSSGGGDGLKLDAVDDILLRFDYVSVARN